MCKSKIIKVNLKFYIAAQQLYVLLTSSNIRNFNLFFFLSFQMFSLVEEYSKCFSIDFSFFFYKVSANKFLEELFLMLASSPTLDVPFSLYVETAGIFALIKVTLHAP